VINLRIDKKLLDKEYATNYLKEVEYLKNNKINPSFIKDKDGITTFKYTKTYELFDLLKEFYK
jgi:hypothetical protein